MTRTFHDDDLLAWEAYASSGEFGYARPARIVFHCRSDPSVRPRYVQMEDEDRDAAAELARLPDATLTRLLGVSRELT